MSSQSAPRPGILFSFKPAGPRKPGQPPASPDLEKGCPARITREGAEKPKKSCKPQKIKFRIFIQPYEKSYAKCKVVTICISTLVAIALIAVLIVVCGVLQTSKDRTEDRSTGAVLGYNAPIPSATVDISA